MAKFLGSSESKLDIGNKTKFTDANGVGDSGKGVAINAAKSGNGGDISALKTFKAAKDATPGREGKNDFGNGTVKTNESNEAKSGSGGDLSAWGQFKGAKSGKFGDSLGIKNEADYAKKGTGA